ncbi:MAG: ROK family protein, partial [Bacteroidales bacterium]|nr:ROK family protein [Bacteroidales bacterium]
MSKITLCADIGGTHITCRLFDLDTLSFADNAPVVRTVNCHGPADQILNAWAAAITEAAGNKPVDQLHGLGFAMPGPFDYPNGIGLFSGVEKFDALNGVNIKKALATRLKLPDDFRIRFLNDATCFAIGESLTGAAKIHQRLLAITLGTGFGTTFIDNHRPVAGVHGIPDDGFLYHVPVGHGIADDWFSTRWFLSRYEAATGNKAQGVKELAAKAINDPLVATLFDEFGRNLGRFLAPRLSQFHADALVIGGSISGAHPLFGNALDTALQQDG